MRDGISALRQRTLTDKGRMCRSISLDASRALFDSQVANQRPNVRSPNQQEDALVSVAVLRLGSPRRPDEGLRIGTVRRPPRGVPRTQFAKRDFYDVWLPNLSPSRELVALGQRSKDERSWKAFARRFRAEMNKPDSARLLDLLAALSHQTNFSVGCYCENEARCHRSMLRELLAERGAHLS
jgi:uncharacterized protein YeaO (DUF488 family)